MQPKCDRSRFKSQAAYEECLELKRLKRADLIDELAHEAEGFNYVGDIDDED